MYDCLKLGRQNHIFHLEWMPSADFLVTVEVIRTKPRGVSLPDCSIWGGEGTGIYSEKFPVITLEKLNRER